LPHVSPCRTSALALLLYCSTALALLLYCPSSTALGPSSTALGPSSTALDPDLPARTLIYRPGPWFTGQETPKYAKALSPEGTTGLKT